MALLEVLFAGPILAIAILGLALLLSLGQTSVVAEGEERVALYLAHQRMEQLRTLGYDNIVAGTSTEPAGTIPGFPQYGRTTEVAVPVDPDGSALPQAAKAITITVLPSWRRTDVVAISGMMFRH